MMRLIDMGMTGCVDRIKFAYGTDAGAEHEAEGTSI